jgi:hypothetical protein
MKFQHSSRIKYIWFIDTTKLTISMDDNIESGQKIGYSDVNV